MSLEDAVARLTDAILTDGTNAAIREIIRQRDALQVSFDQAVSDREYHKRRSRETWEDLRCAQRKISALKGVITRMKRDAKRGSE